MYRAVLINLLFLSSSIIWAQTDTSLPSTNVSNVLGEKAQEANSNSGIDFDQQDPFMNAIYQKGRYLIYDCIGKYWVCTGDGELKGCKRRRKEAFNNYDKNLSCAYFSEFDSRKECRKHQQRMTHSSDIARFCLHPVERDRRKDF